MRIRPCANKNETKSTLKKGLDSFELYSLTYFTMKKVLLSIVMVALVCLSTFGFAQPEAQAATTRSGISTSEILNTQSSVSELQEAVINAETQKAAIAKILNQPLVPAVPTSPLIPTGGVDNYNCNSANGGVCTCYGDQDCQAMAVAEVCVVNSASCDNFGNCICTWDN